MTRPPIPALTRWLRAAVPALALTLAGTGALAAEPPPYNAGLRMGSIPYRQVGMPVALTYPTRAEAAVRDLGPYRMTVAIGAPGAQAPAAGWPVVFVSHGTGGSHLGHADLVAGGRGQSRGFRPRECRGREAESKDHQQTAHG